METFKIIIITISMSILNYACICAHECIIFRDQKKVRDSPRAGATGSFNRLVGIKLWATEGAVYIQTLSHLSNPRNFLI